MLEVILLIAAVAIGLVIVMRMDVDPRTPKAESTSDEVLTPEASTVPVATVAASSDSLAA